MVNAALSRRATLPAPVTRVHQSYAMAVWLRQVSRSHSLFERDRAVFANRCGSGCLGGLGGLGGS